MDDLSREARALLDEARQAYSPDPGAADRVLARVMAQASAPIAPASSGMLGPTAKVAMSAIVLAMVAGSAWLALRPEATAPHAAAPAPMIEAPSAPEPAPTAAPSEASRALMPPAEEATEEAAPIAAPPPVAAPAPSAAAEGAARRRESASSASSAPDPMNLATDLRLLREAQSALSAGRAGDALALLRDHQRAYPRTQFRQERDAIRILALCAAGQEGRARRLGERFLRRAGHSPMAGAVRESCAGR